MLSRWLGLGVGPLAGCLATCRAEATPIETKDANTPTAGVATDARQQNFGFGAELGFYNPSGIALRAGARDLSLDVAAGFVPVLLSYGSAPNPKLKLLVPLEVSPQLLIHAITFRDDIRGGLRLGYRYNAALGHGATLGAQIGKRVTRKLLLEGVWGVSYYPNAADRLRGNQVPRDTSFNFPPQLGYGLTVSLLFYP
jgi:hypothetical protein